MTINDVFPRHHLELLVATMNRGKLGEIQDALEGLPIKVRRLDEFPNVSPVEEVGLTYKENAILKALGYSKGTGLLALADDSGLEIDTLGGGPGVLSARFGGAASDGERLEKLLLSLKQQPNSDRTARFVCCMALAGYPSDERLDGPLVLAVTEGKSEGIIADAPRGSKGFGYDPIFIPEGYPFTFAELRAEVKNKISHRAKALAAMREFLTRWREPNLTGNETAP